MSMCTCNLAPQPCKSCQDHWADNRPDLQANEPSLDLYDLQNQALDLAQDLKTETVLRNPRFLRLRYKTSRKRLYQALLEKHDYIMAMTEQAYLLVNDLGEYADNEISPGEERERIARKLEQVANTWTKPKSFSYPLALKALAAEIRAGK